MSDLTINTASNSQATTATEEPSPYVPPTSEGKEKTPPFDKDRLQISYSAGVSGDFFDMPGIGYGGGLDLLLPVTDQTKGLKSGIVGNVGFGGSFAGKDFSPSLEAGYRLSNFEIYMGLSQSPVLDDDGNVTAQDLDWNSRLAYRLLGSTLFYPKLELSAGLYGNSPLANKFVLGGQTNVFLDQNKRFFYQGEATLASQRLDTEGFYFSKNEAGSSLPLNIFNAEELQSREVNLANSLGASSDIYFIAGKQRRSLWQLSGSVGKSMDLDELTADVDQWSLGATYNVAALIDGQPQNMEQVLQQGPALFVSGALSNTRANYLGDWVYGEPGLDWMGDTENYREEVDSKSLVANFAFGGSVIADAGNISTSLGNGAALSFTPRLGVGYVIHDSENPNMAFSDRLSPSIGFTLKVSGTRFPNQKKDESPRNSDPELQEVREDVRAIREMLEKKNTEGQDEE